MKTEEEIQLNERINHPDQHRVASVIGQIRALSAEDRQIIEDWVDMERAAGIRRGAEAAMERTRNKIQKTIEEHSQRRS